jgi:TonB dependent receptor
VLFLDQPLNVANAVYTGVEFSGTLAFSPHISLDASYNVQAAYAFGVDRFTELLQQLLVNNQQFLGTPLHKEDASLRYRNHAGTSAYFGWIFFDQNSNYHRPPFSIYSAGATLPLGEDAVHLTINNIFNKATDGSIFGGVPYPGFSGPYPQPLLPYTPNTLIVTYDHRWGAMR